MTQQELADKIGVSRGTIGMYEIGKRDPDTNTLIKIAQTFNVTTDYLLGNTSNPKPANKEKLSLEEKYPEVHDVEEAMEVILAQPGLMLKGSMLSDESKIILANAIQMGLRTAEELERKKREKEENNQQ